MNIHVCFKPADFIPELYKGYNAVVIDVFRATTSIATAFANGCKELIPVEKIDEAFKMLELYPDALLAGEREGILINGFNLGNSPFEYSNSNIGGKTVIMTTTNGTFALKCAANTEKVYTASFVNCAAVCQKLEQEDRDIVIICSGTEGRFSVEDTLCAGLISDRLNKVAVLSDTAQAAQAMYQGYKDDFENRVSESSHAKYLKRIGFDKDIDYCLKHDILDVVPVFQNGTIKI
ncbi:2-phosphosulfolactate phosphatase [Dendrosporobacter sp. 1207_IL3150]|uniref:2-phosphosulfolactate phosphatase n=1 Tax=Dendrosporobacter sp. 1207_IL3150 TaxID=3084054 RepID=UPI002FD96CF7